MSSNTGQRGSRSLMLIPDQPTWGTMLEMARSLFASGLLPEAIKKPEAAVTIMQKGIELGIPPMAALNGIAVINGKPACSSELMGALIYRDHGDNAIDILETTNTRCTVAFKRRGWASAKTYTFTIEDAKRAELTTGRNGHTWRKYPAAMLRARCLSAVARMAFQDSIGGMHTPEELGAEVDESGGIVVIERHIQPPTADEPITEEPAPIEADYRPADPEPPAATAGIAPRQKVVATYGKATAAGWTHEHLIAWLAAHDVPGDGLDAMNHLTHAQLDELNRDIINRRRPTLPVVEAPTEPEPESPPATPADLDEFDFPEDEDA